jgi:hypothetical protein
MVFKFLNGTIQQQEVGRTLLHNQKNCFVINKKLIPLLEKKNTKYKTIIPVSIRVTCPFYKLSHRSKYLQCNKLFVIDKSLVNMVLHKFVCVINEMFRS